MSNESSGLKFIKSDGDRFWKSPYKDIIEKHGQTGRDAILTYEVAKATLLAENCYIKVDGLFWYSIAQQLQISERKVHSLLEIAFEYGLFHKKLFEAQGILTSEAIQDEFFTIKQGFRYDLDTIPCTLMLIPFDRRMKLSIGIHHIEQDAKGKEEIVWCQDVCRLYKKNDYNKLFKETGVERDMQLGIDKKML